MWIVEQLFQHFVSKDIHSSNQWRITSIGDDYVVQIAAENHTFTQFELQIEYLIVKITHIIVRQRAKNAKICASDSAEFQELWDIYQVTCGESFAVIIKFRKCTTSYIDAAFYTTFC